MSDIDLRLGRWQDVLADVQEVDTVIVDAPYSSRTHAGHDGAPTIREAGDWVHADGVVDHGYARRTIGYVSWGTKDIREFVRFWSPRTRGWMVSITDHELAPVWASEMEDEDRYVFAPLPYVATGSRVRLSGDGPSTWTCWIVVGRPRTRELQRWGTLPGAYVLPPGYSENMEVVGGKPLWIMRSLVRDYTRKGDLVCDPCAGAATTLIAAATENRRAVGAEMDLNTYALAMERIRRGYTPSLDFGEAS